MNARLDHCLVVPQSAPAADWATLVDGTSLSGVAALNDLTLGQTLCFHRAETGERVPVVLRHLLGTDGATVDGAGQLLVLF